MDALHTDSPSVIRGVVWADHVLAGHCLSVVWVRSLRLMAHGD